MGPLTACSFSGKRICQKNIVIILECIPAGVSAIPSCTRCSGSVSSDTNTYGHKHT